MADIWQMLRGGHWPTLLGAWLHLTVSFMVWLLIGALSLPMARALELTGTDLSVLVALPLLGGALLRVFGGWSCDWFGAKNTAVAILIGELAVLLWGWLADPASIGLWCLAVSLGLGGASFAVALPLAGQAYPPSSQGLVLGLAASGNIGTVLVLFLAPRWAESLGWQQVFGIMAGIVTVTCVLFILLVRESRQGDRHRRDVEWWHHAATLLRQRSAYWLCFLYAITFGGFVGLCSVLPMLLYETYGYDAVAAGSVAALCGLVGSVIRPFGGYAADQRGGMRVLYVVLPLIVGSVVAVTSPSQAMGMAMIVLASGAMGVGNGVVFQMVAEEFPEQIGMASGLIGAVGSVGGFAFPIVLSGLKLVTGSYDAGLWFFAGLGVCAWGMVFLRLRGAAVVDGEGAP
ncbi:MFS transporter [Nitrospira lenta]|uniref:Nitrate/nitrite transporter n=1 Tax=Nitrospira lenta TaxID=1436998 RepID=A0A330L9S2_9BACT|nr:MFS transporter [Nitrospira lenta]SPP66726.1 Nitrate/nitrite transporter [Nitrospira lenta]